MIKPQPVFYEDQPGDSYLILTSGPDAGKKINLNAIQEYASLNLPVRAIAGILGLGERTIYSHPKMKMSLYTGRGINKLYIAQVAMSNIHTPTVLTKLIDSSGIAQTDPDEIMSMGDGDSPEIGEVTVSIRYPKKPGSDD